MDDDLSKLQGQWPLSDCWEPAESFTKDLKIGDLKLRLFGLCAYHREGTVVSSLAVDFGEEPWRRAYLDLIRKTAIVEAELSLKNTFPAIDPEGNSQGVVPNINVFPLSPDPVRWQYASSSAAAADESREAACRRAANELIERDRVLRSWFGAIRPVPIALSPDFFPKALTAEYDFQAFQFPESANETSKVTAVYGFARREEVPSVGGFGAGRFTEEGLAQARSRCYLAMGSLWGETIPQTPPPFSPTAEYHQEVYLREDGLMRIKRWLAGDHVSLANYAEVPTVKVESPKFVDLTPESLRGQICVVKAISKSCAPLTFGASPLNAPADFPTELLVHPLA